METLENLRIKIKLAGKNNDWQQVLELAGQLIENYPGQVNAWDKFWLAKASFMLNMPDRADSICTGLLAANPDFDACKKLKVRLLWQKLKGTGDIVLAKAIFKNMVNLTGDDFWLSMGVLRLASLYMNKGKYDAALKILESYKHLDYPQDVKTLPDGHKIPSNYELFNLKLMKCYVKLEKFDEAVSLFETLNTNKFTSNTRKWLGYYYALALSGKGNYWEAIDRLLQVPDLRRQWFVWFDIARIAANAGNRDAALFFAVKSLTEFGKPDIYKAKALTFIAGHLPETGKHSLALALLCYLERLYKEQGFKIPSQVEEWLEEFGTDFEDGGCAGSAQYDIKKILHEILESERYQGRIYSIKGKYGFIQGDDGEILYFFMGNLKCDKKVPEIGTRVRYNTGWSFDRKKRQLSKQAINIEIVE